MKSEVYLKKIGENITRIRKSKGLTSKELGYQCEIDKSALIHIEKGRINVTVNTLLKIAHALDVEVAELFKFLVLRYWAIINIHVVINLQLPFLLPSGLQITSINLKQCEPSK